MLELNESRFLLKSASCFSPSVSQSCVRSNRVLILFRNKTAINTREPFLFCVCPASWRGFGGACLGVLDSWVITTGDWAQAPASDRQPPLPTACAGERSRDPPCWFMMTRGHGAEDSARATGLFRNTQVLFCSSFFILLSCSLAPGCTGDFTEINMWNVKIRVQPWVQRWAAGGVFLGNVSAVGCIPPSC